MKQLTLTEVSKLLLPVNKEKTCCVCLDTRLKSEEMWVDEEGNAYCDLGCVQTSMKHGRHSLI